LLYPARTNLEFSRFIGLQLIVDDPSKKTPEIFMQCRIKNFRGFRQEVGGANGKVSKRLFCLKVYSTREL